MSSQITPSDEKLVKQKLAELAARFNLNVSITYAGSNQFLIREVNNSVPIQVDLYKVPPNHCYHYDIRTVTSVGTISRTSRWRTLMEVFKRSRAFKLDMDRCLQAAFLPASSQISTNGIQTFQASTESSQEPKDELVTCSGCGSQVKPGNCGNCTRRFLNAESPSRMLSSRVQKEYDQLKKDPPQVGRDLILQRIKAIENSGKLN